MATGRVTTFPLKLTPVFEDKECVLPQETESVGDFGNF